MVLEDGNAQDSSDDTESVAVPDNRSQVSKDVFRPSIRTRSSGCISERSDTSSPRRTGLVGRGGFGRRICEESSGQEDSATVLARSNAIGHGSQTGTGQQRSQMETCPAIPRLFRRKVV